MIIQNTGISKEYDLTKILQLAEENNKQIRLAQADLQFAGAQMKEAISTALTLIIVPVLYYIFGDALESLGEKLKGRKSRRTEAIEQA